MSKVTETAAEPEIEFQCRLIDLKTDKPVYGWRTSQTFDENPGRGTHNRVEYRKRYIYYTPPAQAVDLEPLRRLYMAYVRLLESGRDRIIDLGGTCDPVDQMERMDADLIEARNLLGIKIDQRDGEVSGG